MDKDIDARVEGADAVLTGAARVKCQVCGRMLVPRKDGTSRAHYPGRYQSTVEWFDRSYCRGAGYRLVRWPVGQRLQHHSGDLWEVVEDRGGRWGDYYLRCLSGREEGREMVAHGEYMHRHGWRALPPDLMAALERSLSELRPSSPTPDPARERLAGGSPPFPKNVSDPSGTSREAASTHVRSNQT